MIDEACRDLEMDVIIRDLKRRPPEGDDIDPDDIEESEVFEEEDDAPDDGMPEVMWLICGRDKGLRGVFVAMGADNVQLTIATPASYHDYALFGYLVHSLKMFSGTEPAVESDEKNDLHIDEENSPKNFSYEWILKCVTLDFFELAMRAARGALPWSMDCFNYPLVLGPIMMEQFHLYPLKETNPELVDSYRRMLDFLARKQWEFAGVRTSTPGKCMVRHIDDPLQREAMENNEFTEEDARRIFNEIRETLRDDMPSSFTLSAIPVQNKGIVPNPLMIINGDYLTFFNLKTQQQLAAFPMSRIRKFQLRGLGEFIDDRQFCFHRPLNDQTKKTIIRQNMEYQPEHPFVAPNYPGMGRNPMQRTFVFVWRNGDAAIELKDFRMGIPRMLITEYFINDSTADGLRMGDQIYFVANSPRLPKGIMMTGIVVSNPTKDSHSVEFKPTMMVDPRHELMMTSDFLEAALPEVDWSVNQKIVKLSDDDAQTLEELWAPHLEHCVDYALAHRGLDPGISVSYPHKCEY